uniref:Uncharacterized protein n=1 Tax=Anguilla anguilla TaxID=7936 RepID=A0A0E9TIC5_ANGAN
MGGFYLVIWSLITWAMLRGILEDAFRFGILLRPALCSFIRSVVFKIISVTVATVPFW